MTTLRVACLTLLFLAGGFGAAAAQETPAPSDTSRAGTAGEMRKGDAMKGDGRRLGEYGRTGNVPRCGGR